MKKACFALVVPLALSVLLPSGCSKSSSKRHRGAPPPPHPSASAQAGACAGGGASLSDPDLARFFPRKIGSYCLDPHADVRIFGLRAPKPLDAICTEAFDGECEIYKRHGLTRVALLKYVDGTGSGSHVDVVFSQYASEDGAYGMFTRRVIADGDPARKDAPKPMKVDGVGALGTGASYVWRGKVFLESTFTNVRWPPKKAFAESDRVLPLVAARIASRLPGAKKPPAAASLLPSEHLLPLGVQYAYKDAFGVQGAGAGAIGYYRDGDKRYRVLMIPRQDEDQAKDVLGTLAARPGAKKSNHPVKGTVRLMVGEQNAARAEWLVAHKGKLVVGVGDEPRVLANASHDQAAKLSLSRAEKERLLAKLLRDAH